MKNILLPTDFSANSMNAIHYAMHFFENWKCNFFILNVQKASDYITDDLMTGSSTATIHKSIAADNKKLINQLVKKLGKQYKTQSYSFHGLFDYDGFVPAIDQAVKLHAIELIIMGTNGATGTKEAIFGSNTLQVIRKIDCPLLAIPEKFKFKQLKVAMLSTQGCENIDAAGVKPLKNLLIMHMARLNVIAFNGESNSISDGKVGDCLPGLFKDILYTTQRINEPMVWATINTASQLLQVDLNTIFVENESFLERLFLGSDTSAILYGTKVPLLLLKH